MNINEIMFCVLPGSKDSVQTHFLDVFAMHRENHDVNCAVFNYPLNSSFVFFTHPSVNM